MTKVELQKWIEYLESRVDIDVYVYGGNGETIIILLPKICNMEESIGDVDRVLTLLQKRLLREVSIYEIRGVDCSGLAIRFLLDNGIITYDMTANGLYEYIVGTDKKPAHGKEIPLKDVKAGDYLFMGSDTNKHHVGYAISEKYAIESQNHDVGVVETSISERGWKYAARPDWYIYDEKKPVLKRELYYIKENPMTGNDVKNCQELLIQKGYNPGIVDGIFGKNTEIAVKNFQDDEKLDIKRLGTVGKKTATALGFIWEG